MEMLLPTLLELLKGRGSELGDALLRKHCLRTSRLIHLLILLCGAEQTRSLVSGQVSAQLCLSLVESLLACCQDNSGLTSEPPGSDGDLVQVCVEAVLKTLDLMSKLQGQVEDMETSFYRMLQDQRMVSLFSAALASHHSDTVQMGLALLAEATPLPDFPSHVLGESIAANNAYRQRELEMSVKRVAVEEAPPTRQTFSLSTSSSSSSSSNSSIKGVHSLIEKFHNGFELQDQGEDVCVSEIIEVYEQKLCALASKESRLQDLLEAKALALSQADRLITENRFQRAQAEAEARKLGSLLKEAMRRREELQVELGSQVLELERSRADTQELLQHNVRLQLDSQEHQALKGVYNTLLSRFNEVEKEQKELQATHTSLTKQTDSLRRSNEALRQQHDKTVSVLEERESKVKSLRLDLQQRADDITALREEVRAREVRGEEKDRERQELEETADALRKELHKTEQARKDTNTRACKLDSLLKEASRRKEELKGQLGSQLLELERSRADTQELLQHNARLQLASQEHQALKGVYNTLLSRFTEMEQEQTELQATHTSLTKQTESLRRSNEALRLQHDKTVSVLEERESKVKSLQLDLQQRADDITALQEKVRVGEAQREEKDQERWELEETVDVLRKELHKTELARKDASTKASSLELQKAQVAAKLKQKEEELNKHSTMIAMIHSLSSGKAKSDVNPSL